MLKEFSLNQEFDAEIDLTPLIDVVFILLIFFIVTSTFIQPSLPVDLPRADSAAVSAERTEQLVITIDADGSLFYEGRALERAELPALIMAQPEFGINLFVDRAAPFDAFVAVLDEARRLGRDDLSITTRPDSNE